MTAMIFLGMAASDIYLPALPQMVIDFKSTPNIINITLSCYTFGIALSVLFVGELSNRYGRRKLLIISMIGYALTSLLIAEIHSIFIVILCRIIQSIGAAITITVTRLVLKDCLEPSEQLKANGILLIGLVVSPAIAPVIGAYLSEHYGWQSTFRLLCILSSILLWLNYKFIPETNTNILKQLHNYSYYLKIYWLLLTNKSYICMVLISACTTAAYFVFLGISSYLFILDWKFSPAEYSWIFLLTAASYLIGNFSMQILNYHNFSLDKIIGIGLFITLAGTIIMALSILTPISAILVIIAAFFMRMGNALINPTTQIKIINKFNNYSAQAIGFNFFIGFSCNSIALNSVTIFHRTPLLGLIMISGIFILFALTGRFLAKPD